MSMKNYINTGFGILVICSLFISDSQAQGCKTADDLLYVEGKLIDSKNTPLQGYVSDFSAAEKKVALKTLNTIESHIIKGFTIQGGHAQAWFSFKELYYFDTWLHETYEYKMGFYNFACDKGKNAGISEYISDFAITANPLIHNFFKLPPEYESSNSFFNADPAKNVGPQIAVFRYLVFTNPEHAAVINTGKGYYEDDQGDVHNKHRDIYRIWYITHPEKKLFKEVSRKEYLSSLLEYYDRERMMLNKKFETKIAESKKYVAQYEKSANKAMVQSHLENKQSAENKLIEIQNRYLSKKEGVSVLLNTKSEDWLNQVATINPGIKNSGNSSSSTDFDRLGYFTFSGFDETAKAAIVYKWNPDYFNIQLQSPAEPLFFRVSFRYKANTPFTLNILDNFVKNLSFEPFKKLLVTK